MDNRAYTKLTVLLKDKESSETRIVCCEKDRLADYGLSETPDGALVINGDSKLVFVDTGKKNSYQVGAKLVVALQSHKLREGIEVICDLPDYERMKVIEAAMLSYPEFIKYKTKNVEDKKDLEITFIVQDLVKCQKELNKIATIADSVIEARRIINTAPNEMRPSNMADEAWKLQELGIKCKVLEGDEIGKMQGLVAVGKGSSDKPNLIVLERIVDPNKPIIAIVGKGVTFDTGGYSLKPAKSMTEMHSDMSGAATVFGIMSAAAKLALEVNLVGVAPCAENMVSSDAMRPEDIYTSYSGQTVHVLNTDAEGRLILADALSYVQDIYKPSIILDFATLTGAVVVALGEILAGAYANDDELFDMLQKAGEKTFERIWRMPLLPEYNEMMDSKIADMKNVSDAGDAGSATAAAFLGRFVDPSTKWVHFDIAGTAFLQKAGTFSNFGATGFGIRLAIDFIAKSACKNQEME